MYCTKKTRQIHQLSHLSKSNRYGQGISNSLGFTVISAPIGSAYSCQNALYFRAPQRRHFPSQLNFSFCTLLQHPQSGWCPASSATLMIHACETHSWIFYMYPPVRSWTFSILSENKTYAGLAPHCGYLFKMGFRPSYTGNS